MDFEQLDFLDMITVLSFIVGLQSLEMNNKQGDSLMGEMRDNQNTMLEKIIRQNEIIIAQNEKLLQKGAK